MSRQIQREYSNMGWEQWCKGIKGPCVVLPTMEGQDRSDVLVTPPLSRNVSPGELNANLFDLEITLD